MTIRLVGGADGVSPWLVRGGLSVGPVRDGRYRRGRPGLALRRLQPRGPALRLAAVAAGVAAAAMAVAAVAVIVAVISLCLWARGFVGYHSGAVPGVYLALVVAAAAVTTVSAARGARAALVGPTVG